MGMCSHEVFLYVLRDCCNSCQGLHWCLRSMPSVLQRFSSQTPWLLVLVSMATKLKYKLTHLFTNMSTALWRKKIFLSEKDLRAKPFLQRSEKINKYIFFLFNKTVKKLCWFNNIVWSAGITFFCLFSRSRRCNIMYWDKFLSCLVWY